jgi:protoporphyrinogen oxidase
MERFDVIVIGGGISGLSFAYYCAQAGRRTLVLEQSGRAGGALHSEPVDGGFWLELGAHTAYNSYGRLLTILEERGLMKRLLPRRKVRWMLWEDEGLHAIASRLGKWELARSLPRLLTTRRAGLTVEAYYGRVLGKENFRRVVGPMLSAVSSQDARAMPAELLFKKRPRRKGVLRSYTLEGGLQAIPDALIRARTFTVETGVAVEAVRFENGRFTLATGGRESYEAEALALATPPEEAARLLGPAFGEAAGLLARVGGAEVDTVGVAVRREQVRLPEVAGIVGVNDRFFSVISRDTVPHPDYRGFVFHFKPGLSEEERRGRITAVLGVPLEALAHRVVKRNQLPAPGLDHGRLIQALDGALAGSRLLVTGNYFGGLAIEDCIARSAAEAARLDALA